MKWLRFADADSSLPHTGKIAATLQIISQHSSQSAVWNVHTKT